MFNTFHRKYMQTMSSSINIEKESGGSVTDLKITIRIFILMNILVYSILLLIFVLKLCKFTLINA